MHRDGIRLFNSSTEFVDFISLCLANLPKVFDLLLAQLKQTCDQFELFVFRSHGKGCFLILQLQGHRELTLILRQATSHHVDTRLHVCNLGVLVLYGKGVLMLKNRE
jgi:hypothetical protein